MVGPTAVGKTAVAMDIAQHYNTAIISADSRQCYMGTPIGTAQPTERELALVKHYFINDRPLEDEINAGSYEKLGLSFISEVFETNDVVVLCGGTGLYIKALCEGIDEMPSTDRTIEDELKQGFDKFGLTWLQDLVDKEDPAFYAIAEQQNHVRLIRGLAFFRTNNQSITDFRQAIIKERPFNIITIGIDLPRDLLYNRINERVLMMIQNGLLEEVGLLFDKRELKNLQTVGYKEFYAFDHWPLTPTELAFAIDKVKQHSRNYAKRQLTWFKKDAQTTWFAPDDTAKILTHIEFKMHS